MNEEINKLSDLEKIKYMLQGFLKNYLQICYHWNVFANETEQTIEINVQKTKEENIFLMLRIGISYRNQEIYIYNIFLPKEDRKKGIGLGLIHVLFHISKLMNFSLVLHSMTEGFYEAMLKRGAKKTLLEDALQVTDETDLGKFEII